MIEQLIQGIIFWLATGLVLQALYRVWNSKPLNVSPESYFWSALLGPLLIVIVAVTWVIEKWDL